MTTVAERTVGFRSLSEQIDTYSGGKLIFHIFGRWPNSSVSAPERAKAGVPANSHRVRSLSR